MLGSKSTGGIGDRLQEVDDWITRSWDDAAGDDTQP